MNLDKIKKLTTETVITLSLIIDKMEIRDELKNLEINTGNEEQDNKELGKSLILLIISKLYKAKEEIYQLISEYKSISIEEAKNVEIMPVLKEILGIEDLVDFL
jgi:hypothetical protein|nr:MAG TPA_asm: hypothetical protein [Caudoviricetes sp.]